MNRSFDVIFFTGPSGQIPHSLKFEPWRIGKKCRVSFFSRFLLTHRRQFQIASESCPRVESSVLMLWLLLFSIHLKLFLGYFLLFFLVAILPPATFPPFRYVENRDWSSWHKLDRVNNHFHAFPFFCPFGTNRNTHRYASGVTCRRQVRRGRYLWRSRMHPEKNEESECSKWHILNWKWSTGQRG